MMIGIYPENESVQLAIGPHLGPVMSMVIPHMSGYMLAHCAVSLTIIQTAGRLLPYLLYKYGDQGSEK